jgi:hypothetical protein
MPPKTIKSDLTFSAAFTKDDNIITAGENCFPKFFTLNGLENETAIYTPEKVLGFDKWVVRNFVSIVTSNLISIFNFETLNLIGKFHLSQRKPNSDSDDSNSEEKPSNSILFICAKFCPVYNSLFAVTSDSSIRCLNIKEKNDEVQLIGASGPEKPDYFIFIGKDSNFKGPSCMAISTFEIKKDGLVNYREDFLSSTKIFFGFNDSSIKCFFKKRRMD